MTTPPEELLMLENYLKQAKTDHRLKAGDLLSCCSWAMPTKEILEKAKQAAPTAKLKKEISEIDPEDIDFYGRSPDIQDLIADQVDIHDNKVYERMSNNDPSEIPSWFYLDYQRLGEGWLVHFTDHADSISAGGFLTGVEDASRLGLTIYLSAWDKGSPGYNFAYRAEDVKRYAYGRGGPKYGKEAVIFYAPYLLAWHYTDEEPQAIFWGPSATNIHQIYGEPGSWIITDVDEGKDHEFETLDEVEEFLEARMENPKKLKAKLLR